MSFRGALIERWNDDGKPQWTLSETIPRAVTVSGQLNQTRRARAKRFGEELGNPPYIRNYVHGMRLPWLSSRLLAQT